MTYYAKCTECPFVAHSFDEYRGHRVQTSHHLDIGTLQNIKERPWKGVCVKSCWFARKPKCRCRCQKRNHQKGFQKEIGDFITGLRMVGPQQAAPSTVNSISIEGEQK